MTLRRLGLEECRELAAAFVKPYHKDYFAMYSSVLGGVVTHPFLMTVPLDDHMVHRGDGIFETMKCVGGNIYNLARHLDRLQRSARSLHLKLPCSRAEITTIIKETIRADNTQDCIIRLYVSRGPGGFTVNPYECPAPQLYVATTGLHRPTEEEYARGVSAKSSSVPAKQTYFANVKSCNYLPNVLMKKEAVDAGVDYTLALDEHGFLAEGAAENVAIVAKEKTLKLPGFSRVLKGTTVSRALEMLEEPEARARIKSVCYEDIPLAEVYNSEEILIFGTSFDVVAAVTFDGQPVGTGRPGPVFELLHERFHRDVRQSKSVLTPVYGD